MAKYITDIQADIRRRAAFFTLLVACNISMHMVANAQDNVALRLTAMAMSFAVLCFLFDTIARWVCTPAQKPATSKADSPASDVATATLLDSESVLPPLADEDEALACLGHDDSFNEDEYESLYWEAMRDDSEDRRKLENYHNALARGDYDMAAGEL